MDNEAISLIFNQSNAIDNRISINSKHKNSGEDKDFFMQYKEAKREKNG